MKKNLLLIITLLVGLQFKTLASHFTGSELTYKNIAPNSYEVKLKVYRECASIAFPTTVAVLANAGGCNPGRSLTLNLVSQQEKTLTGPGQPAGCAGMHTTNVSIGTYTGILTFTAAEQSCTDWLLSWSTCCRGNFGNLNNASAYDFYTEAHLKLLSGMTNNSPQFDTINYNVSFAGVNMPILISALAQDPDGDSLVYSSVAPLSATNQPMVYGPSPSAGGVIANPNPLPPYSTTPPHNQYAVFPPGLNNYSPNLPISSFTINWNAINPATGIPFPIVNIQPFFELNPHTGNIAFQPVTFTPSGFPGANRYVLAIRVDEYRKVNGIVTKIGTVRRETFIEVMDGGGNGNPYLSLVEMNLTNIAEGDIIDLRPGVPMYLKLSAADLDAADVVTMNTNVNSVLPGAIFTQNNLSKPSGNITWTPTVSDVRQQPYYFNVVLKDNASNLRGYHERTIGVRVRATGGVTGIKETLVVNTNFSAYPNPFTSEVNFRFSLQNKAENILIYNLLGQQVDQIFVSKTAAGEQNIQWNNASKFASGTYVAKLVSADKTVQTLKFTKLQ